MERREDELWERADAVLDQLLDLPEEARSDALLAMHLPADLAACVRRLLQAHVKVGALDHPPRSPSWAEPSRLTGRRIGGWVLQRELGRGGMAVVWQAGRGSGKALRHAAVKLFPVGALARHELARFRREQAILGRLSHPHIAHLYEAGEADDGTPYLVMEKVDGERIDAWCDRHGLDAAARVRLMLQVCAAIAYAHRNLVVHADLKPSNVMVDHDGFVRVLDFGIGRLLDERFAEMTATIARAVTPEYAAPEQLAGEPASTAADVFGLGALLYRLLTGVGPHEHERGGVYQAPSRMLQSRLRTGAAEQGVPPSSLRGDLDAIVLKALRAEPERRYASVDALHADLRAWLDRMPVTARAPSRRYLARKFIHRNRLAVTAVAAVTAALAIGFATTVWQARRARFQAVAAKLQAQRAVAVKDELVTLLQRTDPGRLADDPSVSHWLRLSSRNIRNDRSLAVVSRAELLRIIGSSQRSRGKYGDARETLDAALQLYARSDVHDPVGHARALDARSWVAYSLDHPGRAIQMLRQADALLGGDRGTLTSLHARIRTGLAEQLTQSGHVAEGSVIVEDVVQQLRKNWRAHRHAYGYALRVLGSAADIDHRPLDAIRWLQQSRQAYDPSDAQPDLANVDNDLAIARWDARQFDGAERDFETAVRAYTAIYGADHPRTLTVRGNAAALLVVQGQARRAVVKLQDLLRVDRRVYGDKPGHAMALDEYWLALAYYRSGQTGKALVPARQARRIGQRIGAGFLAAHDTVIPLIGLLRFERQQDAGGDLLGQGVADCHTSQYPVMLRRWICLARALRASDRGNCRVSAIKPIDAPSTSVVDRRWWAVYHLVRARCGEPSQRAAEWRAAKALEKDASPAFPAWLRARLASGVPARSAMVQRGPVR
jgi:eukaryotic-like serine/threonine-protein kinase